MVPVPNTAFKTVLPKSIRLCRRSNGGKNEEIIKFGRQGLQKCFNLLKSEDELNSCHCCSTVIMSVLTIEINL